MTQAELLAGLEAAGYPVAYHHFKSAQDPPFVVYFFEGSDDFRADDENYVSINDCIVELYSTDKDLIAEAALETELQTLGITWAKTEDYIDSEQMYQITYTIQAVLLETVLS